MPYIAQYEQRAIDKGREIGRQEGRQEGIKMGRAEAAADGLRKGASTALKVRFPDQAADLIPGLEAIQDPNRLLAILDAIERDATVEEIKAMIEAP